jgi:hypothetical protein
MLDRHGEDEENIRRENNQKKEESGGYVSSETAYRRACSLRLVFFDPGSEAGDDDSIAVEFFLWQEIAHQRSWYFGSSHIFVQCFMPVSCAQWQ